MTPETPRTTTPLESESLLVTGPCVRKTLLLDPEEEEEEEEAVKKNEDTSETWQANLSQHYRIKRRLLSEKKIELSARDVKEGWILATTERADAEVISSSLVL